MVEGKLPVWLAHKEFSLAQQACRTTKEDLVAIGANALRSAGRMHLDGRSGSASRQSREGRCAGTGTGRLRFADATLEKTRAHIMLAVDNNQFYIYALCEALAALNFGGVLLPILRKLRDKYHKMRVIHRDWDAAHFPALQLQRAFVFDDRFAHLDFEFVLGPGA